jgi:hypothetical protein
MKRKALTSAATMVLAFATSSLALADAIIAPFFDTRGTSNTFVSVVTKDPGNLAAGETGIVTHWVYLFKDLDNANEQCQHSDGNGMQTVNDLGTFNLGAQQTVLETGTTSVGRYITPGFAGMLTIYNNSDLGVSENSLVGEVLFISDGAIGTYRMLNDPFGVTEGNFDDAGYGAFGISTFPNTPPGQGPGSVEQPPLLIWHPEGVVSTSWLISVLDVDMDEIPVPNMAIEVALGDADFVSGAFYDRDENRTSTSQTFELACLARAELSDLIDAGGLLDARTEGGWAHLLINDLDTETAALDPAFSLDRSIIVNKIEQSGQQTVFTSENRYDF